MDLPMRVVSQDDTMQMGIQETMNVVDGTARDEITVEAECIHDGGYDKRDEVAKEGTWDDGLPRVQPEDGYRNEGKGKWEDEDQEPQEPEKTVEMGVEPKVEEVEQDVVLDEGGSTQARGDTPGWTARFSSFWEAVQHERKIRQEKRRLEEQQEFLQPKVVVQQRVEQQPTENLIKKERKARKKEKREMIKLNGGQKTKKQKKADEMTRLRECERELTGLRTEGSSGEMHTVDPPPPPPDDREEHERRAGFLAVLERVWESQSLKQDVSDSETVISGSLTGNVSVNGERQRQHTSPERPSVKEERVETGDLTSSGGYSRVGDKSNEFQFEMVVDLKGLGKRKRPEGELEDHLNVIEEDMVIPTITKVVISLESSTEYRIVVSGERSEKRLRNR